MIENPPVLCNKRRQYNLVYRIRKKGFRVNTKERTIFYKGDSLPLLKSVNKLREDFGFYLQIEIRF